MRNYSKILLTVALVCILMIRAVMADEVRLKNGDRLSGKIITMGDGDLVLETSFADKIKN